MSEETKLVEKVEIDAKTLEFIKSKADDMDKYKAKMKEQEALLKELQEKLPAGEQKPIKDQLLELLAEKEQAKTAEQIMQEQLQNVLGEVNGLKEQLTKAEAEKVLIQKQAILKDKANELKFQNPDLVSKLIDINGDIETQLKVLAESNPYLIKQEAKPPINQSTNFCIKEPPADKSKWTPLDYLNNTR
jgi:CRISPR/Cas system CMR-associated protein Cmr5 small subunit